MHAASHSLPMNGRILEIGSGPGTATLPLLKRGFHVTCIEPSSGMIQKAKHVCHEYMKATHIQESRFIKPHCKSLSKGKSQNKQHMMQSWRPPHFIGPWIIKEKLSNSVMNCSNRMAKLVLLWNIPPEPNENVRNAVAKALDKDTPFYFSAKNREQHKHDICETVLAPVRATGLFHGILRRTTIQPKRPYQFPTFISMVRTFSHYIRMPDEERETFFDIAETTMTAKCVKHRVSTCRDCRYSTFRPK